MTNMQLSTTGLGEGSFLVVVKGDTSRIVGSGRELRSDKGETSIDVPAPRSRESNGRLGVIDEPSSSFVSH